MLMRRRERSRQKEMMKAFTFSNREQISQQRQKKVISTNKTGNLQASNQLNEYFSFRIQDLVDVTDNTLAWTYNVPVLSPNQKQTLLVIQQFQVSLINYASDIFPQTISIGLDNFSGYKDSLGGSTNRIIVLQLIQVMTTQMVGYVQRDLIFKSQNQTVWSLGALKNLKFRIYLDQNPTPLELPLTNPLNVCFKILHVTY